MTLSLTAGQTPFTTVHRNSFRPTVSPVTVVTGSFTSWSVPEPTSTDHVPVPSSTGVASSIVVRI